MRSNSHVQLKDEADGIQPQTKDCTYVLEKGGVDRDPYVRAPVESSGCCAKACAPCRNTAAMSILLLCSGFGLGYLFEQLTRETTESTSCSSLTASEQSSATSFVVGASDSSTDSAGFSIFGENSHHFLNYEIGDRASSDPIGPMPGFPDTQPNILTLLVDDLGYNDVSFTGAEYPTPNIDEIFNDGIWLKAVYGMPLCTPSRAAMFTGRFTYKLGLQMHEVLHQPTTAGVPLDIPLVGEYLQDAGYSTHYFGRWALGHASEEQRPLSRGYDTFNGFLTLMEKSYTHITVDSYRNWEVLDWWNGEYPDEPTTVYNDQYSKNLILEKIDDLYANDPNQPWSITWSSQTVHKSDDTDPPPLIDGLYEPCDVKDGRPVYCKRIVYLDHMIGEIMNAIKEKGWWDNTLVVFTTDNGASQGVSANTPDGNLVQNYGSNYPFRGSKGTFYEGAIRVITAIGGHWIPEEMRGTVDERRHHLSDYTTTVLDVAQSNHPYRVRMDGKNLFTGDHDDRLVISINPLTEITWFNMSPFAMGTCVFYGDYKYIAFSLDYSGATGVTFETGIVNITANSWSGFDGDYNTCWRTDEETGLFTSGCLFNIHNDPQEQHNLWEQRPDVVLEIQDIINEEFFGGEYRSGQNMEHDMRVYTTNIRRTIRGQPQGTDSVGMYLGAWIGPDHTNPTEHTDTGA